MSLVSHAQPPVLFFRCYAQESGFPEFLPHVVWERVFVVCMLR